MLVVCECGDIGQRLFSQFAQLDVGLLGATAAVERRGSVDAIHFAVGLSKRSPMTTTSRVSPRVVMMR